MKLRAQNAETLYATTDPVLVDASDLAALKTTAAASPRKRARICAHTTPESRLHEMIIVLQRDCYIRPHRHPGRAESFSIIEGNADVVLFTDDGGIRTIIPMGSAGSGRTFYYRLAEPTYHTVLVRSETLVFHEVTDGPFRPEQTTFAAWAPPEDDPVAITYFLESIRSAPSPASR
jgi:cupin fold WbuC family metalloprotein